MDRNGSDVPKNVSGMRLDDEAVRCFRQAKIFREFEYNINHIDFSPNSEGLVASGDDDQIVVYNCDTGQKKNVIFSKKYGVDLVQFAPRSKSSAIYASTKVDDTLRYLSLHDNKYIRYFKGHGKKVVGLHMSPKDACFVSGSLDRTVRLWDIRSNNAVATIQINGKPYVSYDPDGTVFATFLSADGVSLYDARNHGKGPFKSFDHQLGKSTEITGVKFSPNGRHVLVATTSQIYLYDSFTGAKSPLHLGGHVNRNGVPLEASFSPDSQYIFSGSTDGMIHIWNAQKGYKVCVLNAETSEAIRCIKFSPKHMLLATGCSVLSFWLPALKQETLKEEFPDMDDVISRPRPKP